MRPSDKHLPTKKLEYYIGVVTGPAIELDMTPSSV